MYKKKPKASISLDLDNQWSYMKIHGDEGWDNYPSYFNIFVPHILDVLDELDLKITFFIVGKDAEMVENRKYLRMITERGHEVGNHSYYHESWLQSYSYEKIENEIVMAEEAIYLATGQRPRGFRGPGFSWSNDLLEVLKKREYIFDASTLPTWLGPLARAYYFWKSDLPVEEKKARKELFGKFSDGLRPNKPYFHSLSGGQQLLEIPVSTIPIFRIPFHLSYLVYLSGISPLLMKVYLSLAILMCRITNTSPSYLLHPLDLIGGDKVTALAFFPGMNITTQKKVEVLKYVLRKFKNKFEVQTMLGFANQY